MKNSMAVAYALKKKAKKMADGGQVSDSEGQTLGQIIHYPGTGPSPKPKMMAHGGDVSESHYDDLVDRIMEKRLAMSEGGEVANATPIHAGFEPAEFDDLVLRDDLSSSYGEGDNSGDELGNAQEAEDRHDIVARVMRSRAKKDRMPRPA